MKAHCQPAGKSPASSPGEPAVKPSPAARLLLAGLELYHLVGKPARAALFGGGGCCRFYPSCSEYAREALLSQGAWRGAWMTVLRIAKCHPFHPGGHDPVPEKKGGGACQKIHSTP